jgi:nickel-dependent lactate racemase
MVFAGGLDGAVVLVSGFAVDVVVFAAVFVTGLAVGAVKGRGGVVVLVGVVAVVAGERMVARYLGGEVSIMTQ